MAIGRISGGDEAFQSSCFYNVSTGLLSLNRSNLWYTSYKHKLVSVFIGVKKSISLFDRLWSIFYKFYICKIFLLLLHLLFDSEKLHYRYSDTT